MKWDSCYAEPGPADRNIALRNRPHLKPVEERGNIVSNRVIDHEPHSDTTVRLESGLEGGLLAVLKVEPGCVGVRAQYLVHILVGGVWTPFWFDACADFVSGCRVLFAVRNDENAAEVDTLVDLFRDQELPQHAHFAVVLTEEEISKPAVYRAEETFHARRASNKRSRRLVMQALLNAGGRARVANVLAHIPGLTFARGWDALGSLIDRGLVVHDHPRPEKTYLKRHSWIRATEVIIDEENQ
ncbi:hypothetical protein E5S70_26920 [Ensifer adhaerens]|uniref:hypothetical protein n=1 Tax=Ensifer canadensis TaxID=555315 RepID=UPI00148FEE27|nr:hypothetical protein [Ensifer canadensis]NOV19663.1 hypothetical protein [Ensifer canadensis]